MPDPAMKYAAKVFLGALIMTGQGFRRHPVIGVVVIAVAFLALHTPGAHARVHVRTPLEQQVATLTRACAPRRAANGIMRCTRSSTAVQRMHHALQSCARVGGYVGYAQRTTWVALARCLDWWTYTHPQ